MENSGIKLCGRKGRLAGRVPAIFHHFSHPMLICLRLVSAVIILFSLHGLLLHDAEKKFGISASKVLMADGSQVEELSVLREKDEIFVC